MCVFEMSCNVFSKRFFDTALLTMGYFITYIHAGNILLIGDSFLDSYYINDSVGTYCSGSTSLSAGISGTTATDWANMDEDIESLLESGNDAGSYDVVWFSVGGNDYLNSGCSSIAEDIVSNVAAALNTLISQTAFTSDMGILMTGSSLLHGTAN